MNSQSGLDSDGLASHTFIWEHPGEEVFVTGTFDDWGKSVQMEKRNGIFKKKVKLPKTHTMYKFIVDGTWVVNPAFPTEDNGQGIVNNILLPEKFHTVSSKRKPDPSRLRTWTDRSGSFKVKAEFLTVRAGKLHLHKENGVKIAVPLTKMSVDDIEYAERETGESLLDEKTPPALYRRTIKSPWTVFRAKVAERDTRKSASQRSHPARLNPPINGHDAIDTRIATVLESKNLGIVPLSSSETKPDVLQNEAASQDENSSAPTDSDKAAMESSSGIILAAISTEVSIIKTILSMIGEDKAMEVFSTHEITDLWLPLSRQTVRRLFVDGQREKQFMQAQTDILDTEDQFSDDILLEDADNRTHLSLEDDESLITEHGVLGEGLCGIVEEVSFSTRRGQTRCVRKRIGRPKLLKAQKKIMTAFAREIGIMRQVEHQHCVRFLASYTDFDHVNILSAPVADMDLATFLDGPIHITQREILYRGVGCLCGAINYLHKNNIRHEDLKPQNVLIHGNSILLTDFGFSLDFSDDSVSTTTGRPSAWTIRYSAPEVLDFEPRNRATDIWSLGCILLEMVSGFYGTSLSDLKEGFQRSGNGQTSFARNIVAVEHWFDNFLEDFPDATPTFRHLSILISTMLNVDRLHRPSAQQIVDHISEISLLVSKSTDECTACCAGPTPCVGLSENIPANSEAPATVGLQGYHNLAKYLHPWCYEGWACGLWDLEWNVISMPSKDAYWTKLIHRNHDTIRAACDYLYSAANNNGSTKSCWDAHQKASRTILSSEGIAQAQSSATLVSIKHIVFTRLSLSLEGTNGTDSGEEDMEDLQSLQITLIPICHPRSPFYGNFFWMLSWSAEQPDTPVDYECVDLTDM